jgi:hypothetical protein
MRNILINFYYLIYSITLKIIKFLRLIFSDMSYYIKQFKGLNGLHLISINFEDVWAM